MDNKRFNLASHWAELEASFQKIFLREIDFRDLMVITKGWNPTRQFRILEVRANRISKNQATIQAIEEQLTQTWITQWQESPFFTISDSFQENTRIQGQEQNLFQLKAEGVRPNDPEAVGLGERITQEPQIAVHTSRISSPINRNITPTQIEHNFVTPESNLNINVLWLQMSQYAEQTQKQFAELQASHERMKTLRASMDKIFKTLQEGHAQLSKASEETNERLNQVFQEQHQRKWTGIVWIKT
ncbi:hypothetical protein O181_043578 [Austropuccinia psidii MF-1]|uniref:Uncharacterized protein n=1 Tax=Austropuccinia psidii MF-1 TaxID=1389203 RepID=A0A9Q3DNF2_9BASI|nr:hypothetical protein [Austropuccinia psidii MF-1]